MDEISTHSLVAGVWSCMYSLGYVLQNIRNCIKVIVKSFNSGFFLFDHIEKLRALCLEVFSLKCMGFLFVLQLWL